MTWTTNIKKNNYIGAKNIAFEILSNLVEKCL